MERPRWDPRDKCERDAGDQHQQGRIDVKSPGENAQRCDQQKKRQATCKVQVFHFAQCLMMARPDRSTTNADALRRILAPSMASGLESTQKGISMQPASSLGRNAPLYGGLNALI